MTIQAFLDDLLDQTPGCTLTAFGDLSSKLILRSSTTAPVKREKLDQLCEAAEKSFAILDAVKQETAPSPGGDTQSVICFSSLDAKTFARCGEDLTDLTCTVTGPGHSLRTSLQNTQKVADQIAGTSE